MANPVTTLVFSVAPGGFNSSAGTSGQTVPADFQTFGLAGETLTYIGTTTMEQQGTLADGYITGGYGPAAQSFSLSNSENSAYDGTYSFDHLDEVQPDGNTFSYAAYTHSIESITFRDSDGNLVSVNTLQMKTALDAAGWVNPENGASFNGGLVSSSLYLAYGVNNATGQAVATIVDYDVNGAQHNTTEAILAYMALEDYELVSFVPYAVSGLQSGGFQANSVANVDITCFAKGTYIKTELGEVRVESLKKGDFILTADNKFKPISWIGSKKVQAKGKLSPVRIKTGALGKNLPEVDLLVSRQHRMLVSSAIAERMFGTKEVLIPAIKLTQIDGIFVDESIENVEYFHILFDQHEVIFANNAPSESLFIGPQALKTFSAEAREEIFELFPELAHEDFVNKAARQIPDACKQKKLIHRHLINEKSLIGCDI